MIEPISIILVFAASWLLVGVYTGRLGKRWVIAHPTERGSHVVPVPSGAGIVVFAILTVASIPLLLPSDLRLLPLIAGALAISIVGFVDDIKGVPLLLRLAIQAVIAAATVVYYAPDVLGFGVVGTVFLVAVVVLFINIYNFMDGSDSMVALSSLPVLFAWAVLAGGTNMILFPLFAAAAVAGLLIHNWHPARVFMGDAGSTAIGYIIGMMPVVIASISGTDITKLLLFSAALSLPFLADTIFTRAKRVFTTRKFWEPNREHLYQKLIDRGWDQRLVALCYASATMLMALAVVLFAKKID